MKGAIIGDIVGSRFEFDNNKSKQFELFSDDCFFTDDTVMTCAVGAALLASDTAPEFALFLRDFGRIYPDAGYGGRFFDWIHAEDPKPYHSWGNGAAMRCSPAGFAAKDRQTAIHDGIATALPTHNHPEGIKAAHCTCDMVWMARKQFLDKNRDMTALRELAEQYYEIPSLDEIRPCYRFSESSQKTMPVALAAFLESTSFEDAIRNAISVGGDSDTIGAITGAIAEAYYGVPDELWEKAATYLDELLLQVVDGFYRRMDVVSGTYEAQRTTTI